MAAKTLKEIIDERNFRTTAEKVAFMFGWESAMETWTTVQAKRPAQQLNVKIAALADTVEALGTMSNYIEAHNIAVMIRQLLVV